MIKKIFAGIVAAFLAAAAYGQNAGTVTNHAYAIGKGPGVAGYTSLLCASGQLAIGSAVDPTCRTVSGDATLSATGVLTFATVNPNVGTFGGVNSVPSFTVNAKGLITGAAANVPAIPFTELTGLGTGVSTALGINVGTAGSFVVNGGALGSPSSVGTFPAFTSGAHTITSASANALAVGLNGATNPTLAVDNSAASQVSGVNLKGGATTVSPALLVTDTATNTGLNIDTKGTGILGLNTVSGAPVIVGPAGTGTTSASMILSGGSGANAGAQVGFRRNNVPQFAFGNSSAILGGTSDDFVVYNNSVGAGTTPSIQVSFATGATTHPFAFGTSSPTTKVTNYTLLTTDNSLIFNLGTPITLTLQAAATYPGRWLMLKSIGAGTVISSASNVVPQAGGAAGTAILAAGPKWALLQSDGTNWQVMMSN